MKGGHSARRKTLERADGLCEAMVTRRGLWRACGCQGTDVHHMLPRARGGLILDAAGESYHLVLLCRIHHRVVHENPEAASAGGLTLDGYVLTGLDGRPCYVGTDPVLAERYGNEPEEPALRPADHAPPRPLAGPALRRPPAC